MSKKKDSRRAQQGADTIRQAERKLAAALTEVDEARAKVARRERKLSALLLKYGPADGPPADPAEVTEAADHEAAQPELENDAAEAEPVTTADDDEQDESS